MPSDESASRDLESVGMDPQTGLPDVPRSWWLPVAVTIVATFLLIVGVIIPFLGGRAPRVGGMIHGDDPQTLAQSDGTILVTTRVAARRPIERIATYTGTVVPLQEEIVYPRVSGWVKEILVDEGDKVSPGQVVALLDDVELQAKAKAAEAAWSAASAGASGAQDAVGTVRAKQAADQAKLAAAASAVEEARARVEERESDGSHAEAMLASKSGSLHQAEAMRSKAVARRQTAEAARDGAAAGRERANADVATALARAQQAGSALTAARADRDQAQANIEANRAKLQAAQSEIGQREADFAYWEAELTRSDRLLAEGAISQSEHDGTQRSYDVARNARDASEASRSAAQAALDGATAALGRANAAIESGRSAEEAAASEARSKSAAAEQAAAMLKAEEANVLAAVADIEAAEAMVAREAALLDGERAAVEGARSRLEQARFQLEQAAAREREAQAVVEADRNIVLQAMAASRDASARATGAYESYVAQRTVSEYTVIRALTGGTVSKRAVDPGTLVAPGMAVATIASYDAVRIQAKVADQHLREMQAGDRTYLRYSDDPRDIVDATVSTVFPAADMSTRTGTVELVIDNSGLRLRQNQFVKVDLVLEDRMDALVVPAESVQDLNGQSVVFVMTGGVARLREVVPGVDNGMMTELVLGVEPGEEVIVKNASRVYDGAAVSTTRASFDGPSMQGMQGMGEGESSG